MNFLNNISIRNKLKYSILIFILAFISIRLFIMFQLNIFGQDSGQSERTTFLILTILPGICLATLYFSIFRSIVSPLNMLKSSMEESVKSGELYEVNVIGKNEIKDLTVYYNILVRKLRNQFWIKDIRNALYNEISGIDSIDELSQRTLSFLCRELNAGKGALYLYDHQKESLILKGTFALTEREQLSKEYALGEGIIGQVGLERKPILLANVHLKDTYISTAVFKENPLNVFTFPLIYEDELYGVIELASFEPFTDLKQEFIQYADDIISLNLYAALQSQKNIELLRMTEQAHKEVQDFADELQKANAILEDQQFLLQQQTEELQQANAELEEQQQLLQQQSEELQLTNSQLEEQQQILEEQSRLLNTKNLELERSEQRQANRTKELELASKYKNEFLANMSHELRTPLNSIILLSKLLMKNGHEGISEDYLEKVNIIHKSGNELLRLINDILDLSKVESGKMNIYNETFHSQDLIKELEQLFKGMAQEKNIKFIVEDYLDRSLFCDYGKISQVLRNLLSNAIKFTDSGSVILQFTQSQYCENAAIFTVKDTGIGITPEKISNIFEEFQQGDGSISRQYGGTGLGLSISKKMAELMGGEITVKSNVGIGSEFSLYLKDIFPMESQQEAIKECAITEYIEELSPKSKKLIMIIEDNGDFAEHIKSINNSYGFDTIVAQNGKVAKEHLEKVGFDLIILNLQLKDESGIDICKFLSKKNLHVPIVSYTSQELPINQEKEIKKYVDSIIVKTAYSHERLLDEVMLFLHRVKKKEENQRLMHKTNNEYALRLDGKTVMIVDDDPRNIFVLATALEEYGAEIVEAENGEVALGELSKYKVDLILMDIMMPVLDGFETTRLIRTNKEWADIPIISITAKSLKEDREKCIEAGANDYISKPIDYDTLIRLVKAWTNQ